MNYVKRFLRSGWMAQGVKYLANPKKMRWLLTKIKSYVGKRGLRNVKDDLGCVTEMVSDVVCGRYRNYSKLSVTLAVAALVYVVSPLDIVPDFLIGLGFLDDVAIVAWAAGRMKRELDKYVEWKKGRTQDEK